MISLDAAIAFADDAVQQQLAADVVQMVVQHIDDDIIAGWLDAAIRHWLADRADLRRQLTDWLLINSCPQTIH